jgi:hypothetical protein
MTETITHTSARPGRSRRLALAAVAGAALLSGLLAGVHSAAGSTSSADPCPCTLPQCKTVCNQN